MSKKVLFLVNITSGKGKAKDNIIELVRLLNELNYEVSIYLISPSEELTSEKAIDTLKNDYESIIFCGGDGTLNHVINSLYTRKLDKIIGYCPSGSTNDFAMTLYGERELEMSAMAKAIEINSVNEYDVLKFNDKYYNYVAAFGMFTKISYDTDQLAKNKLGYVAYLMNAVSNLGENINVHEHARIEHDGKVIEGDFALCGVSNTVSIAGIKSDLFKAESVSDGIFEVTLIKSFKGVAEFNEIISCVQKGIPDGDKVITFKTSECRFIFDEPVSWSLDGEDGGSYQEVTISVSDKKQKYYKI